MDLLTVTNTPQSVLTVYRDKRAPDPAGYINLIDGDELVELLRFLHKRKRENKENNFLVSSAIFDPTHPNGQEGQKRGKNNIVRISHIWLDFENGDLRPDEIPELFPKNRIIVYNTFNHTNDAPRYRVIFPVDQPMTPDVYEAIWDNIRAKIESAGYWVWKPKGSNPTQKKPSGLDRCKRTSISLFYALCQANDPKDSFFDYYNDNDRQAIEAGKWIENSVVFVGAPPVVSDQTPIDPDDVDRVAVESATAIWRESRNHPREGNKRFFDYALSLREAGMPLTEIEATLRTETRYARHPKQRENQISSIMSTLERVGWGR